MYNVLITDDEQIVVDSLSFIMNKEFPDQVKVYSALSGAEAIEITGNEKIDIVFMDIQMSGINGLETVSCILRIRPDTVIIMLSAFDRFQYAQEAINLGAFKYITKPVNRNLVVQTVREAMTQVDKKRGNLSSDSELHKKLDLVLPMVESDFIYSCIFSSSSNGDVSSYFDYFNITEKWWCFCCLELPGTTSSNQFERYTKLRTLLNSHCKCLLGSFMANRLVVFFPLDVPDGVSPGETARDVSGRMYNLISLQISHGVRCGVSPAQEDTSMMAASYNQALDALASTDADGGICFAEEENRNHGSAVDSHAFTERILGRLSVGDGAGVQHLAGEYVSALFDSEKDLNRIKSDLFGLLVTAKNAASKICASIDKSGYENEAVDSAFGFFSGCSDKTGLEDFVKRRLVEMAGSIASLRVKKENPVVKKVSSYVRGNLSEDLSLETVAQTVGVSSFYLSKLFKEETGETFINYVTDCRLEESRKLLRSTEKSVKEITADVGYNDQNYFSKLFKNKYGVSPTEYRTLPEDGV